DRRRLAHLQSSLLGEPGQSVPRGRGQGSAARRRPLPPLRPDPRREQLPVRQRQRRLLRTCPSSSPRLRAGGAGPAGRWLIRGSPQLAFCSLLYQRSAMRSSSLSTPSNPSALSVMASVICRGTVGSQCRETHPSASSSRNRSVSVSVEIAP